MRNRHYLLIIAIIVVVGSLLVPDSRAPKIDKHIVADVAQAVTKEIQIDKQTPAPASPIESQENPEIEEIEEQTVTVEELTEPTEIEESDDYIEASEPGLAYIGTFEVTAYEWTGYQCANGNYPSEGYTVACNSLPLGTEVYIDGVGWRVVEDRGADWHSASWMDLYLGDVNACYEWGVQYREVYVYG